MIDKLVDKETEDFATDDAALTISGKTLRKVHKIVNEVADYSLNLIAKNKPIRDEEDFVQELEFKQQIYEHNKSLYKG